MSTLHTIVSAALGLLILAAAGVGPALGSDATAERTMAALTVTVRDALWRPLAARVTVLGSDGRTYPAVPDAELLSHSGLGGFFYVNGSATLDVPTGATTIVVSRGFEYRPVQLTVTVNRDTTVRVGLTRSVNPAAGGWFCGDAHAHAWHNPLDYDLTPSQVAMVAKAEGLSVLHLLDDAREFTGAPHEVSDASTILYCSYEHRNQFGGHAGLPALASPVVEECCMSPAPPLPMLLDLAAQVHAQPGARVVLAHPRPTDDYGLLSGWPGAGLGRELPLLAALGGLDALDVASYSNEPDLDLEEWFELLSAGIAIPPSAGTDAPLDWYDSAPPGGWRVYCRQTGTRLDYDAWLDALVAGRCFVTSYPLITGFSVGGCGPGEALEVAGDSLVATVDLQVSCVIGLTGVTLVADGREIWSRPVAPGPTTYAFDTSFVLRAARPGWVLLRADGTVGHPATAASAAVAYTNAVRVLHDGAPARQPEALVYWLERIHAYDDLVASSSSWSQSWQRDTVLARIARARSCFDAPFGTSPAGFALASPSCGDTARAGLAWSEAVDPDSGDRVTYRVRVGEDSTLADAWSLRTAATFLSELSLVPGRRYWWSVEARDLAGNIVPSAPALAWFVQPGVLGVPAAERVEPLRAWPNPSRGAVRLAGLGVEVAVYDLAGRRVAGPERGIARRAGEVIWDGSDGGRPAAPGIYLARSRDGQRSLRIVRLR